ncbi:hypothetical protein OsI_19122 [Oryza sativa Indica Group]|uniref:Uncharacterized protein n=1 Tax=Oryza sativa subsp. indica TaxID=39946 RepID=B8AZW0_ORYSI|nr:hypothetical protein OsI_19122 [Oryza sativa Indica Group]
MSNGRGEREDEEVFLGGIADEVIDVAMEKVLGEIFDNIEVEGDGREDGQKRKRREEEGAGKEEKVVQLASVKEVLLTPKRARRRNSNGGCITGGDKDVYFPVKVAHKLLEGDVESLIDPNLHGDANLTEVERVCKVACWCIQDNEFDRPTMGEVVQILEGIFELDTPPMPRLLQAIAGSSCSIAE